jgi:threonine/homoserine/homoserine lactone efflux protein
MLFILWIKAVLLGIIVTAPVGPVGALVIRRTLRSGAALGIATGLGAALADTFFAFVAALGMSRIEPVLKTYEHELAWGGGLLLLAAGGVTLRKSFNEREPQGRDAALESAATDAELSGELTASALEDERRLALETRSARARYFRAVLGSLAITFSNPVTIVGFAGTFAAFGFWSGPAKPWLVFWVVSGVFSGAMLWWSTLSLGLHRMRKRLSKSAIFFIQLLTSGIILLSGLLCLMRGFLK